MTSQEIWANAYCAALQAVMPLAGQSNPQALSQLAANQADFALAEYKVRFEREAVPSGSGWGLGAHASPHCKVEA